MPPCVGKWNRGLICQRACSEIEACLIDQLSLWGASVDRGHSQLIIILLSGIFAVLLFGREATYGSIQTLFSVGLVLGIIAVIVWAIVSFIGYMGREARVYREEVRRDREEGRPWLYQYLAWPGIIGNFLVFGVAAYSRYVDVSCRAFGDCLQQIPYWWLPISLFLASILVSALEQTVRYFRKRETQGFPGDQQIEEPHFNNLRELVEHRRRNKR
jgi:hypothetical protein